MTSITFLHAPFIIMGNGCQNNESNGKWSSNNIIMHANFEFPYLHLLRVGGTCSRDSAKR